MPEDRKVIVACCLIGEVLTLQTRASSYCRSLMALFFESRTSWKVSKNACKTECLLQFNCSNTSSFLVTMVRAEGSKLEADNTSFSCAS